MSISSLSPVHPVLILDDDRPALQASESVLRSEGVSNILLLDDSRELLPLLARQKISVLLLDWTMPHYSGEDLLFTVAQDFPDIRIIIVTGTNEVGIAVNAMKGGAFDFMVKPLDAARLVAGVKRAIDNYELALENDLLRRNIFHNRELKHPGAFSSIVTQDAAMKSVFQYIEGIASSARPVLITGETGVGKELFARAVHTISGRSGKFVPVAVAGLDDTMISDTLFGHAKGAYTGAEGVRPGLISQASNGTLFLDEIGDLSEPSQIKLLRLLQEHEYMPLGSDIPQISNARIVVATHQDLNEQMRNGAFRRDLFYRLRAHHVEIPPLRKRLDDLPLLIDYFVEKSAFVLGCRKPVVPADLRNMLKNYGFPGNVRELETMVYEAVSHHKGGQLSVTRFAHYMEDSHPSERPMGEENSLFMKTQKLVIGGQFPTLKESSELLVDEAMKRAGGNQRVAARLLGISPPALSKRLKNRRLDHGGDRT